MLFSARNSAVRSPLGPMTVNFSPFVRVPLNSSPSIVTSSISCDLTLFLKSVMSISRAFACGVILEIEITDKTTRRIRIQTISVLKFTFRFSSVLSYIFGGSMYFSRLMYSIIAAGTDIFVSFSFMFFIMSKPSPPPDTNEFTAIVYFFELSSG